MSVVRQLRSTGIKTALISNAEGRRKGSKFPDFDAVVLSGEVGVAKPDPAIFQLTARLLEVAPAECVFVDDLAVNARGAAGAGMVGVRHTSVEETVRSPETVTSVAVPSRSRNSQLERNPGKA